MATWQFEFSQQENPQLEKYLTDSIIDYGIRQLNGSEPIKIFCCCKNNDGALIGAVMGSASLNLFYISHIFVEERQRNRGLGAKLLAAIEGEAVQAGCNIVRLNTLNKAAHAFYLKAGYKQSACIEDYIQGFDLVYFHKKIA